MAEERRYRGEHSTVYRMYSGKDRPRTVQGERIPYEAAVPELVEKSRKPVPQCLAAFIALGYRSEPEALNALLEAAASDDWYQRKAAVEAIPLHREAHRAVHTVRKLLLDRSSAVACAACSAVGRLRHYGSRDTLLQLLDTDDPVRRRAAVVALGHIWSALDFERVLRLHETDRSPDVRDEAARVLRENVTLQQWHVLFDAWKRHALAALRVRACEVAEEFGDRMCVKGLKRLRKDRDPAVRNAAQNALSAVLKR
ncbi:MAG: HEAT repeat domain-containing protein [Planctomycetota bacterium]|jgi:HEAT repeat protein